jgi:parallel beta-helix repeat protein
MLLVFILVLPSSCEHIAGGSYGGKTLYVGGSGPGNYSKIQDAIDNASNGDRIFVYNGTYDENLRVNKSIHVIGEDKNTTIIDGGRRDNVVDIIANEVTIIGFTIQNSARRDFGVGGIRIDTSYNTIIDNIVQDNDLGIFGVSVSHHNLITYNNISGNQKIGYDCSSINTIVSYNKITNNNWDGITLLGYCDNNLIFNNTIMNNPSNGIELDKSSNNSIINNTIIDCYAGISIRYRSSNNIVSGNIIINSTKFYGITIGDDSNDNVINENIITNCIEGGIRIYNSSNTSITRNILKNNRPFGIRLMYGTRSTTIQENTFENNMITAFFTFCGKSMWAGNYWDRPRLLPKPLFGIGLLLPRVEFDWHPAKEPYSSVITERPLR